MPVYNEEGAVADTLAEWTSTLDALGVAYEFRVLDDGSKDSTGAILDGLAPRYAGLHVTHKPNSGHGPTILQGYRESLGDWVFQIDSDRELLPDAFARFWSARDRFDYIQGYRVRRVSPLARRITSAVARGTIRLVFGTGLRDVNCPYRLMRGEWLRAAAADLPAGTLTPNVLLSGLAIRDKLRLGEEPVEHRHRTTGTVSIRRWKLFKFAMKALWQVLRFRFLGSGRSGRYKSQRNQR